MQDFQKVSKSFDHNRSTTAGEVQSLRWQPSQNCCGLGKTFLGRTVFLRAGFMLQENLFINFKEMIVYIYNLLIIVA